MSDPGGFDKRRSAGYLANHMARLFAGALARRVAPLGLAPAQFAVLLELWREDGLTQRELTERLDVEQATMANTLSRMERDGLVGREACAHDRRARSVRLTAKGLALEADATGAARRVNEAALDALSPAEREAFLDMMRRTIDRMREDAL